MPCDYSHYPPNWLTEIRPAILDRARNRSEGSPNHWPDCRAKNYQPHPVTGSPVVLTVAHLDHDVTNNDPANLRALCQRCHFNHDAAFHAPNRRRMKGGGA
jgi:hypothetical protein